MGHLVQLDDKVKQLSEPNYHYVSKSPPHLYRYLIRAHRLASLHPFQGIFDLKFLNPTHELSVEVI
jgi:hypothetical protein